MTPRELYDHAAAAGLVLFRGYGPPSSVEPPGDSFLYLLGCSGSIYQFSLADVECEVMDALAALGPDREITISRHRHPLSWSVRVWHRREKNDAEKAWGGNYPYANEQDAIGSGPTRADALAAACASMRSGGTLPPRRGAE